MDMEQEVVPARDFGRWFKVVAAAICVVFVCADVWAAAALAYDNIDGTLGHGIGLDKATAKSAAIADCTNNGATQPVFWFWYRHDGWGASAYSDEGGGNWYIGGALGYSTKKKAKRKAKRECKDGGGTHCQIVDLFHDTTGTKSTGHGKSFHLSSK